MNVKSADFSAAVREADNWGNLHHCVQCQFVTSMTSISCFFLFNIFPRLKIAETFVVQSAC